MKQSTLLKNRKGEYKMLFFKKKKENKKTDILIEKDVPSLKEISINYDTEKLNMKLTNLNQSSWHLKKSIKLTPNDVETELSILSPIFNQDSEPEIQEFNLEFETLSTEASGPNDEFYCLEVGLMINDITTTIYKNNNSEITGVKINIIGDIENGITDIGS